MRILAVFKRVILEMLRDRRTLALMMFGPLLMLSLIWAMFQTNATQTTVLATQNVDASLVKAVDGTKHLKVVKLAKNERQTPRQLIRKSDYAGVLKEHDDKLTLTLANNNPSQSKLIRQGLNQTGTAEPDTNNQTAAGNAPNTACSTTSDRQAAICWRSVNGREKSCG